MIGWFSSGENDRVTSSMIYQSTPIMFYINSVITRLLNDVNMLISQYQYHLYDNPAAQEDSPPFARDMCVQN